MKLGPSPLSTRRSCEALLIAFDSNWPAAISVSIPVMTPPSAVATLRDLAVKAVGRFAYHAASLSGSYLTPISDKSSGVIVSRCTASTYNTVISAVFRVITMFLTKQTMSSIAPKNY